MFTIDLLKGQGIPARSRPEGVIATAVTVVVPVAVAAIMFGIYLSNRVVMNIQKRDLSNYEQKISQLSDIMRMYKSYERRKSTIQQRISEAALVVDRHQQWSDILVTIVKDMPESIVLKRMTVELRTVRVKVPDSENPKKNVNKMVPAQTLSLTLGGAAGAISDREVKDFRDKLRVSSILNSKLEDIPVSQQVEMVDDREIITYEMKCILKPQI